MNRHFDLAGLFLEGVKTDPPIRANSKSRCEKIRLLEEILHHNILTRSSKVFGACKGAEFLLSTAFLTSNVFVVAWHL